MSAPGILASGGVYSLIRYGWSAVAVVTVVVSVLLARHRRPESWAAVALGFVAASVVCVALWFAVFEIRVEADDQARWAPEARRHVAQR